MCVTRKFLNIVALLLMTFTSSAGLEKLMVDGAAFHPSLKTRALNDDKPIRHLPAEVLSSNPYHASNSGHTSISSHASNSDVPSNPDFVTILARAGSQGRLPADGVVSALYALHHEEKDLGFYGLEMASTLEADEREQQLHDIWKKNVSLDRARVHRYGLVVLLIWHDGVSADVWLAINKGVEKRFSDE